MRGATFKFEVAGADPWTTNFECTKGDTVPRKLVVVIFGDLYLDSEDRLTHISPHGSKRIGFVLMATRTR